MPYNSEGAVSTKGSLPHIQQLGGFDSDRDLHRAGLQLRGRDGVLWLWFPPAGVGRNGIGCLPGSKRWDGVVESSPGGYGEMWAGFSFFFSPRKCLLVVEPDPLLHQELRIPVGRFVGN